MFDVIFYLDLPATISLKDVSNKSQFTYRRNVMRSIAIEHAWYFTKGDTWQSNMFCHMELYLVYNAISGQQLCITPKLVECFYNLYCVLLSGMHCSRCEFKWNYFFDISGITITMLSPYISKYRTFKELENSFSGVCCCGQTTNGFYP